MLLAAKSLQDMLDQLNYLNAIGAQDKQVATQVGTAKAQVKAARAKTAVARQSVQHEEWLIAARAQQQAILRGDLLTSRRRLVGARTTEAEALVATRAQERAEVEESQAIQAASAQLAAKIQAAEAAARSSSPGSSSTDGATTTPSPAGLIWPVSGPISRGVRQI